MFGFNGQIFCNYIVTNKDIICLFDEIMRKIVIKNYEQKIWNNLIVWNNRRETLFCPYKQ